MSPAAIQALIWLITEALAASVEVSKLVKEIEAQGGEMTDAQRAEIAARFGTGIERWRAATE